MKDKKVFFRLLSALTFGLCLLFAVAGCVSKDTYQQAVNKNADLSSEMAKLRHQIAQLQAEKQAFELQLEECNTSNEELSDANAAAKAALERQRKMFARRMDELQQQLQELEQQKQLEEQKRLELENVSQQQSNAIKSLEQNLAREQIARKARIAKMASTYNKLVASLEDEIHRGEITISKLKNRLTVNMVEKILFPSGSATLSASGQRVIRQVGEVLKKVNDKNIRVEGHSDNLPISKKLRSRFPSNWELSAARAATVVRFLQRDVGISGKKLAIVAYGPYRPVASNATAKGRTLNRRIQIVLVPREK